MCYFNAEALKIKSFGKDAPLLHKDLLKMASVLIAVQGEMVHHCAPVAWGGMETRKNGSVILKVGIRRW